MTRTELIARAIQAVADDDTSDIGIAEIEALLAERRELLARAENAEAKERGTADMYCRLSEAAGYDSGPDGMRSPEEYTGELLARQAPKWRTIDSAPHGKNVLAAYLTTAGHWRTVMACYYPAGVLPLHEDAEETEDGYATSGWYEECATAETIFRTAQEPTHWMPLPPAPSAGATKEPK